MRRATRLASLLILVTLVVSALVPRVIAAPVQATQPDVRARASPATIPAASAFAQPDKADDYPTRAIRIIVPYTAGGSSDSVARTVGDKLQGRLNQSVIVENRPGGNAFIGTEYVAKAPA